MKGSIAFVLLIIVGSIIACTMLGYIFFIKLQSNNSSSANTPAISSAIPVKDFAPGMPMTQKTTILIMSNDSSEEKYIVPTGEVATYIKHLPPGYHVVSR